MVVVLATVDVVAEVEDPGNGDELSTIVTVASSGSVVDPSEYICATLNVIRVERVGMFVVTVKSALPPGAIVPNEYVIVAT